MTDKDQLIKELKVLIIEECDKEDEISAEEIDENELLFGNKSKLLLDSLDALQISVALKDKYGVHIAGAKEVRKYLTSIDNIADYIIEKTR